MNAAAWRTPLGFGALCLLALPAGAVVLGDLEVRSQPGAPLEARIPVVSAKDEPLRGACFSLVPRGRAPLAAASLELRRSAHGASLFVRTRDAVEEGASFAIAIACPGSASGPAAEYSVRFEAPAATRLPVATPGAPSSTHGAAASSSDAAPLPVVARLTASEGDTLASLAEVIFPRDAIARARYLLAIRAENPSLAAYGDEEPIAPGTSVALPDLHAFAGTVPSRHATPPNARAPARAARPSAEASASKGATKVAVAPARVSPPRASSPPRREEHRAAADPGFRLRLSSPVIDLSPTRGMDERKRAALRERLAVLEADDRTAAMLAMREDIRRLESQVNELKLRLAALPPQAGATKTEPAQAQSPKRVAPNVETAQPQTTETRSPGSEAAKRETPASQGRATDAKTETQEPVKASPAAASTAPEKPAGPAVIPRSPGEEPWYADLLWWLRLLLVPLAGVLGLRYFARRRSIVPEYTGDEIAPDLAITEPGLEAADTQPPPHEDLPAQAPAEAVTRIPAEDNLELRRRYMEERFPEIASGAVRLDDPGSMVKAARLLYDDGAIARSIELLQFAIEQEPDEMRAWLALFAIFRLQGIPGEFAELARRFAERHGASDEWRDVRAIGRTLDPGNPLYEGEEVIAALDGGPEGWLRAPADSTAGLAGELRSRLMAEASVTDADLAPDPIPALRKAEVFSVA